GQIRGNDRVNQQFAAFGDVERARVAVADIHLAADEGRDNRVVVARQRADDKGRSGRDVAIDRQNAGAGLDDAADDVESGLSVGGAEGIAVSVQIQEAGAVDRNERLEI